MRRKAGILIPLELAILDALMELRRHGTREAHGYQIANELRYLREARRLTGYGTLYKALDRLEEAGALESRWEDPDLAAVDARPRRRYYRVTLVGEAALAMRGEVQRAAHAIRSGGAAS